jgi:hypothetical protein
MSEEIENNEPKSTQKPTPSVVSINVCDAIIRDELTKKVSLIGLFNTIRANNFPCKHPQLHVYIALTNGHGKYKTEVRFINAEQGKPIAGMKGEMEFKSPLQIVELNLCWQRLSFASEGEYIVEILCDDTLIGTRKIMVVGPQQNLPPTSGTESN